jgi:hypothetical protein
VVAVVACGDSEADIPPAGGPDASVPTSPTTSSTIGATGGPDGGADDEGGTPVTDGGDNLDPDASDDFDGGDAGPPCNGIDNGAPPISSTCSSLIPGFGGGALVAGTYYLTQVQDLATPTFCKSNFAPVGFKETMVLTVDGSGVGTANTVTRLATGPVRARTTTLHPDAGSGPLGTELAFDQTCPPQATAKTLYSSGIRDGKQTIRIELPYGKGTAVYEFTKQ